MKQVLFLLVAIVFISSCAKIDKLYVKGDDEKVIEKVLRKEMKHLAKESEIKFLESAFEKRQNDLLVRLKNVNARENESKWIDIFTTAREIDDLQRLIERYEPIRAKNGYTAEFQFVDVADLQAKSRVKAADYYESEGKRNLEIARKDESSFQRARQAYNQLRKAEEYDRGRNLDWLVKEAKDLGTVRVATVIDNQPVYRNISMSYNTDVNRALERMTDFSNSSWVQRVHGSPYGRDVDYVVSVELFDVDISRERERAENRNFSKQVREPARNSNGSVITDSLGNTIYTYRNITATVHRRIIEQEAEVEIRAEIVRVNDNQVVFNRRYNDSEDYEYSTCQISGNEEAVPNQNRCRNQANRLPNEREMVEDVLDDMTSRVRRDLNSNIHNLK